MGLVITRKLNETVEIGEATVKVIKLSPSNVQLHIEAPKEVKISRGSSEQLFEGTTEMSPGRLSLTIEAVDK